MAPHRWRHPSRGLAPRLIAAIASASALLLVAPVGAEARSSYCSPTGDYCTQVFKRNGHRHFQLRTFSYRGEVKICVAAPNGVKACRKRRLRSRSRGIWVATIRWDTDYPSGGRGTYRVRFYWQGTRLGPALSFKR